MQLAFIVSNDTLGLIKRHKLIAVHIENKGVGPFVIKKLTFKKYGKDYSNIEDRLTWDQASY